MNQRDRDLVRIAELRRLARAAQGRAEESTPRRLPTVQKWTSGAGEIQRAAVGPGRQVLTVDAAARRLRVTVDELRGRAETFEVVGWGLLVVDADEVERLEAVTGSGGPHEREF